MKEVMELKNRHFDVIIIGGGIIGSSIAYFTADQTDSACSILVIEKDPGYSLCSTTLSAGGIRQQFSTVENIKMSQFGGKFIKSVKQHLSVKSFVPDLCFEEAGYLFLSGKKGFTQLEKNYKLQKSNHVNVKLLSPAQLEKRFKWLNVSDLAAGCFGSSGEGWLDPYSLLMAFIKKAKFSGVKFIADEVMDVHYTNNKITGVQLRKRGKYSCDFLINAAGTGAAHIAKMVGIKDFPVRSRKRFVYSFECRDKIPGCPMVINPGGVYFRPEGDRFLCGVNPPENRDPDCCDFKMDYQLFEELIWPVLALRVKSFEKIKRGRSWAGHYAYNTFDQNAILGFHPEIRNFLFANGFSGHGLQQAPAVGRAICELITFGCYKTLDLTRFAFDRFAERKPIRELNVV